ncbi:autophagy protein atg9 [Tulasnella sp. 403]|nr:autophagy protein atg9 [Tulasnella sp. 403]
MSYESTDLVTRSSRLANSRPNASSSSLVASRPFLSLLNPIGRQHRGYQHLNETAVEEEDEEDEQEGHIQPTSGGQRTSWNHGQAETHELRLTSPTPNHSYQRNPPEEEVLTEPEDDDVPQSFFLESAAPRKSRPSQSRRNLKASRRSRRPAQDPTAASISRTNRATPSSEPHGSPVLLNDLVGTSTTFASTRAQKGLDDEQKALWNWVNVSNLDAYLQEVYAYYTGKGIYAIALSRGLNLLTVGFVIGFSTFLLGCVDYSRVHQDGTGRLSDLIIGRCVSRFSGFSFLLFLCFGGFYLVQIVDFVRGILRLVNMYNFYTHLLKIPDVDIQTIAWPEVVRRISQIREQNPSTALSSNTNALDASELHHSNSPPTATLDAHDIANRIMRQENYLIALFNKDLLDLRVPLPWFVERYAGKYITPSNTLTRALEWNLRYCVLGHLFDRNGRVRKSFLKEKQRAKEIEILRRRFIFMGVLNAIFAPFIVLYLLMYSFFRYFEEYHKNPSSIGGRQYTPYAEWKFREFNELPHLFRRRLNESYPVASEYIDQFPKEKVALVMRFVAFIAGSFAAVLALATVWDPDIFLNFEITPHRTVLFYLGLFGSVLAVARGMVPDAHRVFDPEILMREVISNTHYMPTEWKGQLHSQMVHAEFGHLFEMRVTIFAQEVLSVIMTPFVLWYSLPPCTPAIIDFFREFTVHVDGLGYVCSFAVFDFKRHGNVNFGAPTDVHDERLMSKEGKMEKSFLNFKVANPEWNPTDPSGSAYLSRLADFQHQRDITGLARLRQQRSRVGRLYGQPSYPYAPGGSMFIHPNDTQYAENMGQSQAMYPPAAPGTNLHETRLAEKAAAYDRALQRSVGASLARKRVKGGAANPTADGAGYSAGDPSAGAKGKERAPSLPDDSQANIAENPEGELGVGEIESELGDSYVHGVRTRGPREEDYLEDEDDLQDGGVMGLLAQIYSNQRRAVG